MHHIRVDDRGAVYLGAEEYLAGIVVVQGVRSYIPGAFQICRDLAMLIALWETFAREPCYGHVSDRKKKQQEEYAPW